MRPKARGLAQHSGPPGWLEESDPAGVLLYMMNGPYCPMRQKARGLAQHGGPPGWLEESDPAGDILYVMEGTYRLPFPYCTALTGAAQLRADRISSCYDIVNVLNHPP